MIKRILLLLTLSSCLVSCDAVESAEQANDVLPASEEIEIVHYTHYHHFITVDEEVYTLDEGVTRLISSDPSPDDALDYVKPFVEIIEVDNESIGLYQGRGLTTYHLVGELDDFHVYEWLLETSHLVIPDPPQFTQYVSQTSRFTSLRHRLPIIFVKDGEIYRLSDLTEDFGYDIRVLAHIFDFTQYAINDETSEIEINIPDDLAISHQHLFHVDGERYNLTQALSPNVLGTDFLLDYLEGSRVMRATTLYDEPIDRLYYPQLFHGEYVFYQSVLGSILFYRQYVFELDEHVYYFNTSLALDFTPYYVSYDQDFYSLEDVLVQELLTFAELNLLIGLHREEIITA